MRRSSVVRAVAGVLALGCATVFCQGCNSDPGAVGGGAGGAGGVNINLGLGGQNGVRGFGGQSVVRVVASGGSGGVVADAARADVPLDRKDARVEGATPDAQAGPSAQTDGRQAVASLPVDALQAADQAAARDVPGKEAAVRDVFAANEVKSHLDVGATDPPSPVIDAFALDVPAVHDVAAAGCSYGGVSYAVGDSFPFDCNTCFCLEGGDVVCTVKPCSVDGGVR